ncbi:hypothetical protein BJ878DRAFT_279570 [Calycina marina]|uniref:Uncharacterized protein n=1 Tax=Calycina marina TaxID=1763456 RepID=A0A9P7Z6J6_9HELO|nr:hypothetical protein BJ878DRAFT_279570 [Calycina marina]
MSTLTTGLTSLIFATLRLRIQTVSGGYGLSAKHAFEGRLRIGFHYIPEVRAAGGGCRGLFSFLPQQYPSWFKVNFEYCHHFFPFSFVPAFVGEDEDGVERSREEVILVILRPVMTDTIGWQRCAQRYPIDSQFYTVADKMIHHGFSHSCACSL